MKITDQDVLYVAELANLELTEEERTRMVRDLSAILSYIDHLNQLNTADVPPMAQVLTQHGARKAGSALADQNVFREDIRRPSLPHQEALSNAPQTDGNFFKVPKVIER